MASLNTLVEAEVVRNHLSFVLKWYKVYTEVCVLCAKHFLRAYKEPVGEEFIVLPIRSSARFNFNELASLRQCLPLVESVPLVLAVVDKSHIVLLYSIADGIIDDLSHRQWRPSRSLLENPEKIVDKLQKERARENRPALAEQVPSAPVIVIDD